MPQLGGSKWTSVTAEQVVAERAHRNEGPQSAEPMAGQMAEPDEDSEESPDDQSASSEERIELVESKLPPLKAGNKFTYLGRQLKVQSVSVKDGYAVVVHIDDDDVEDDLLYFSVDSVRVLVANSKIAPPGFGATTRKKRDTSKGADESTQMSQLLVVRQCTLTPNLARPEINSAREKANCFGEI